MARKPARYRAAEGLRAELYALPHHGADHAIAVQRRRICAGHRTHVDLPAAFIPLDAAEARRPAHRRRRRSAGTEDGRLATASGIPEHAEFERRESDGSRLMEVRLQ